MVMRLGLVLVSVVLSLAISHEVAAREHDVGFILDIAGDWFLGDQYNQYIEKVAWGRRLNGGVTLRTGPLTSRARITLVLYSGGSITFRCESAEECKKGVLPLPSTLSKPSLSERVIKAVAGLFSRHPERYYVSALSRKSEGGDELREAILENRDGQVDLGPVISKVTYEKALLRFDRLSFKAGGSSSIGETWVDNTKGRTMVRLDALKPGLYMVSMLRPHDKGVVNDAWVLVCEKGLFQGYQKAFSQAEELSQKWRWTAGDENSDVTRSFLRAYLEALGESGKGS
jgi:hypothetical protein